MNNSLTKKHISPHDLLTNQQNLIKKKLNSKLHFYFQYIFNTFALNIQHGNKQFHV